MVLRTVLKVQLKCEKCKRKILKSVSVLQGVDKIEIDGAKGTLTVTGDADPYEIISRTKKVGKCVEVVTIGPPPAPPKQEKEKPKDPKPEEKVHIHPCNIHMLHDCIVCRPMAMVHVIQCEEPSPTCTIM